MIPRNRGNWRFTIRQKADLTVSRFTQGPVVPYELQEALVDKVAVQKFENRVSAYVMLLRDEYPSTDEDQAVHLELPYPDAATDLNRWLPLIKWFLAIPHYVALIVLSVVGLVLVSQEKDVCRHTILEFLQGEVPVEPPIGVLSSEQDHQENG